MKKTRQVRHTIFIYCEGQTDYLFARHLKKIYLIRGSKKITLKRGTGGDLSTFISETVRNAHIREYNEKYIMLDANGKKEEKLEKAEKKGQKDNIQLIWQRPCLEGVFLRILKNSHLIKEKSQLCKSVFYKEYTNKGFLTDTLLEKLFSKKILNRKREEIQELDQLIQLMEKKDIE